MMGFTVMSPEKYTDPTWDDVPLVLGTQDVADVLGIHVNTVKKLINDEKLPAFKIGRVLKIHKADVMRYVGLDPENCGD